MACTLSEEEKQRRALALALTGKKGEIGCEGTWLSGSDKCCERVCGVDSLFSFSQEWASTAALQMQQEINRMILEEYCNQKKENRNEP